MFEILLYVISILALFVGIQVLFAFLLLYLENTINTFINEQMETKPSVYELSISFLWEFVLTFSKYITWPILFFSKKKSPAESDRCVVLLHGYSRNSLDWWWFRRNFDLDASVYALDMPLAKQGLLESGKRLAIDLNRIKNISKCKEMILVGHSMGGIVCSLAVEHDPSLKEYVSKVITVASPFFGTKISVFGFGKAAKELLPGSEVLEDLRNKIVGSSIDYTLIATNCDHMIIPWDSSLVPGIDNIKVINMGHLQLLFNREVLSRMKEKVSLSPGGLLDSKEKASFNHSSR